MDIQINKLAKQLGDEGVPPQRDLLPGIWDAIDEQESPTESTQNDSPFGSQKPRRLFNAAAGWRMAAVAATLVLLLGSGYFQSISQDPSMNSNLAMNDESMGTDVVQASDKKSLLQGLNQTISDLASAQVLDPNNVKLTRLWLLAHKSRANLLRVGTSR